MKTKHLISRDELNRMCWTFHKMTRTTDLTKNMDLWNAINELDDYNFSDLMDWALSEIGIKVSRDYTCSNCDKKTCFDTRKSFYPNLQTRHSRSQQEMKRMHEELCIKCYRKEHPTEA